MNCELLFLSLSGREGGAAIDYTRYVCTFQLVQNKAVACFNTLHYFFHQPAFYLAAEKPVMILHVSHSQNSMMLIMMNEHLPVEMFVMNL